MWKKEPEMIELSEELRKALETQKSEPVRLVDPVTCQAYVLLRADEYDRLKEGQYEDSDWTDEEMDLLAAEVDAMLDDDMAVEDPS
jgi:hypothetical protein